MKTSEGRRVGQGGGRGGGGWKACGLALVLAACGGGDVSSGDAETGEGSTPQKPPAAETPGSKPPENPLPEVPSPWPRHYGGRGTERLQALASDSWGGFVAGGLFGNAPFPQGTGFALARYSSTGTPEWVRQITTEDVQLSALAVTPDGHILAVGHYRGSPNLGTGPLPEARPPLGSSPYSGLFVAMFSSTGQIGWSRGFAPTSGDADSGQRQAWSITAEAVATDVNGSLIVAGNFHGEVNFGTGPISAGSASTFALEPHPGGFVAKFDSRGAPVWSKVFVAAPHQPENRVRTVATDGAGNILVGGRAGWTAELGEGTVSSGAPLIVKYSPEGDFLWRRMFENAEGAYGEVTAIRSLGAGQVAFTANLGWRFSFHGQVYTGGNSGGSSSEDRSGYVGTLSAEGVDQWIRDQGLVTMTGLATGDSGTLTASGFPSGPPGAHLLVRHDARGGFLWTQNIDGNFSQDDTSHRLFLIPQPGGEVIAGTGFQGSVQYNGKVYTSRGASDLFYFQAAP
jgi:hypothetical protein